MLSIAVGPVAVEPVAVGLENGRPPTRDRHAPWPVAQTVPDCQTLPRPTASVARRGLAPAAANRGPRPHRQRGAIDPRPNVHRCCSPGEPRSADPNQCQLAPPPADKIAPPHRPTPRARRRGRPLARRPAPGCRRHRQDWLRAIRPTFHGTARARASNGRAPRTRSKPARNLHAARPKIGGAAHAVGPGSQGANIGGPDPGRLAATSCSLWGYCC